MGFGTTAGAIILSIVILASAGIVYSSYTSAEDKIYDARNDIIDKELNEKNTDMEIISSADNGDGTATIVLENTGASYIHSEDLSLLLDDTFVEESEITYDPIVIQPSETMEITFTYNGETLLKLIDYSEVTATTDFLWTSQSYLSDWNDGDPDDSFSTGGVDTRNETVTLTPVYNTQTQSLTETLNVVSDKQTGFAQDSNAFTYETMSDRDHTITADYLFDPMQQDDVGLASLTDDLNDTDTANYDGSGNAQSGQLSRTFTPPSAEVGPGGTLDSTIAGEIDPGQRGGNRELLIDNVQVTADSPTRQVTVTITEDSTGNVVFDQSLELWNEQTWNVNLNPSENYTISVNNPDSGDVDVLIEWEEEQP